MHHRHRRRQLLLKLPAGTGRRKVVAKISMMLCEQRCASMACRQAGIATCISKRALAMQPKHTQDSLFSCSDQSPHHQPHISGSIHCESAAMTFLVTRQQPQHQSSFQQQLVSPAHLSHSLAWRSCSSSMGSSLRGLGCTTFSRECFTRHIIPPSLPASAALLLLASPEEREAPAPPAASPCCCCCCLLSCRNRLSRVSAGAGRCTICLHCSLLLRLSRKVRNIRSSWLDCNAGWLATVHMYACMQTNTAYARARCASQHHRQCIATVQPYRNRITCVTVWQPWSARPCSLLLWRPWTAAAQLLALCAKWSPQSLVPSPAGPPCELSRSCPLQTCSPGMTCQAKAARSNLWHAKSTQCRQQQQQALFAGKNCKRAGSALFVICITTIVQATTCRGDSNPPPGKETCLYFWAYHQ